MIKKRIEEHAPELQVPEGLDAESILWAIYRMEKYDKHNRVPRFEPAYAPGGIYYESSDAVKALHSTWGNWAACSYSNFQIMFVTAVELSYTGPPLALDKDKVALPFVVKYVNERIFERGAKTIEEVADAYNSGTHRDTNKPIRYINKFVRKYKKALRDKDGI